MTADLDRAREALGFIPPADRDLWVRTGMALKAEFGDGGFDVWDGWSQGADSYRERDARDVWRSLKPNGGVGPGTLYHLAREHGWRDDGARVNGYERPQAAPAPETEAELAQKRAQAVRWATELWNVASPAEASNPYLMRKGVGPVATLRELDAGTVAAVLGYQPRARGEPLEGLLLVVPIRVGGELSTLELIDGPGRKTALRGGRKAGGWWASGALPEGDGTGTTLLLGEGAATVLSCREATGHPAVAALSSGNLPIVARELRQRYPKARLLILADLVKATGKPDPHAVEAAREVGALLAVPDFGPEREPGETDFNDIRQARGLESVREAIEMAARTPDEPEPAARYPLIWLKDAERRIAEPALIRGLIKPGSMVVTYGESNTGKTFHVLDRDLCLASGRAWYGRETTPGFVLYVAAEGAHSVENRIVAYRQRFMPGQEAEAPFAVLPRSIDLLRPDADVDAIIAFIKATEDACGLACVKLTADTLARVMSGGNENASDDMGRLLNNVDRIRANCGCAAELVHHAGKDTAKGARGHSSLRAATDTEIEVTSKDGVCVAKVTKQRDFTIGDEFAFTLRIVELGSDPYGHPVTTCVPEWVTAPATARTRLTKAEQTVLSILREVMATERKYPPRVCFDAIKPPKAGQNALSEARLREEVIHRGGVTDSDKPDTQSRAFRRALHGLRDRAVIELYEGWVWLSDNPDKPGQN